MNGYKGSEESAISAEHSAHYIILFTYTYFSIFIISSSTASFHNEFKIVFFFSNFSIQIHWFSSYFWFVHFIYGTILFNILNFFILINVAAHYIILFTYTYFSIFIISSSTASFHNEFKIVFFFSNFSIQIHWFSSYFWFVHFIYGTILFNILNFFILINVDNRIDGLFVGSWWIHGTPFSPSYITHSHLCTYIVVSSITPTRFFRVDVFHSSGLQIKWMGWIRWKV